MVRQNIISIFKVRVIQNFKFQNKKILFILGIIVLLLGVIVYMSKNQNLIDRTNAAKNRDEQESLETKERSVNIETKDSTNLAFDKLTSVQSRLVWRLIYYI